MAVTKKSSPKKEVPAKASPNESKSPLPEPKIQVKQSFAQMNIAPIKPGASFKPTGTDYTNVVNLTLFPGSVGLLNVQRRDGKPSYKPDFLKACQSKKQGTESLNVIHICEYKVENTIESELVKVGKKNIADKLAVVYCEGNDEGNKVVIDAVDVYKNTTKSYDKKTHLPTEPGAVVHAGEYARLDEYIPVKAVATVVVSLFHPQFADGSFENDTNVSDMIISQYFGLTPPEDAKNAVLEVFNASKNKMF